MSEMEGAMSKEGLKTEVMEALGAASMCWEHVEQAGVFQSEEAERIGEELLARLAPLIKKAELADKLRGAVGLAYISERAVFDFVRGMDAIKDGTS